MNATAWVKGIFFSVLASVIGAASKLAIRKGWLMEAEYTRREAEHEPVPTATPRTTTAADDFYWNEQDNPNINSPSNGVASNPNEPLDEDTDVAAVNAGTGDKDDDEEEDAPNSRRHLLYTAVEPPSGPAGIFRETAAPLDLDGPPQFTPPKCLFWKISQLLRFAGMIGMSFINPACSLVAMNYASPSILAPFSGLTLVWVIVLSKPLLGEQPSCAQRTASALIVWGEVMVAVFGDHTNDEGATKASVIHSYKEPAFVGYFVLLSLWMLLLGYWMKFGTSPLARRFAWGTSGGSVTGLAQCFIKDSLMILVASDNKMGMPFFEYFFIFLGMLFSFLGLLFLSACMKRHDATYSAAMFVGSFVVSTSIMSAVHYHTFTHLADWTDWIMYPMGLVILMIGVVILVQRGTQAINTHDPLPEPRVNRAYSDAFHQNDIPIDNDATPVVMIPEAIHETTLTERSVGDRSTGRDELELI